jgi:uncharacterized RDD family membrane protein YckC
MNELQELGGGVRPRATFGQRLGAYVVDVILVNVASYLFSAFIHGAGSALFVGFAIVVGYFALFEGSGSGQTIGKRMLGIRVVDFETGAEITYGRALARTIGRLVSGFALFLGYLWMLWDRDGQTWHDKLASTTVVPVASYPVERWPG